MLVLSHLLLVVVWVAASMTLPTGAGQWMFPLVMGLHLLIGSGLLWMGKGDVARAKIPWRWLYGLLLCVPPLAPTTMCLLASGVALRAGLRWDETDQARQDLLRIGSYWRRLGALGVAMGVFWAWGYGETFLQPAGSRPHPWVDPLVSFRFVIGTGLKVLLLLLTFVYGRLLLLTFRALRRHRQAQGALTTTDA